MSLAKEKTSCKKIWLIIFLVIIVWFFGEYSNKTSQIWIDSCEADLFPKVLVPRNSKNKVVPIFKRMQELDKSKSMAIKEELFQSSYF